MASIFGENSLDRTDPETGCFFRSDQFELCRQAYFLKQQNKILQQQASEKMPQTQPTTTATTVSSASPQVEINQNGNIIVFSLVLIIAILVTAMITRHLSKK